MPHETQQYMLSAMKLLCYKQIGNQNSKSLLQSSFGSLSKLCQSHHWRQARRGCRGHIPPIFWLGRRQREYPPILLRTFGYSRPILVALRSLSLKPISFSYKTPPIRFSQAGRQSAHKARPLNLELALTPLHAAYM